MSGDPVMNDASSDARNRTARAISSGRPIRPSGRLAAPFRYSSHDNPRRLASSGRDDSVQAVEVARPDAPFWDWYRESLREFGTAQSEDLLDQMTVRAAEVFVPRLNAWRVTITKPVIRAAKVRMVLATGATKRPILEQVRAGADYPIAQVTRGAGETWWFVDRAAEPET